MQAVTNGTLADCEVEFMDGAAACVVMASKGYPEKYESGFEIKIPDSIADSVFVAGAKLSEDAKLLSAGGRVLGVTAVGNSLESAIEKAYANVREVSFDNAFYRNDIGARALRSGKGD